VTGPIVRVICPRCGGLFARRRDGLPYAHRCVDGVPPPSAIGRRRCACGAYIPADRRCFKCGGR